MNYFHILLNNKTKTFAHKFWTKDGLLIPLKKQSILLTEFPMDDDAVYIVYLRKIEIFPFQKIKRIYLNLLLFNKPFSKNLKENILLLVTLLIMSTFTNI